MTESERGRAFLKSENSLSKGRPGNTKTMHGPGGAGEREARLRQVESPRHAGSREPLELTVILD